MVECKKRGSYFYITTPQTLFQKQGLNMIDKIKPQDTQPIKQVIDVHDFFNDELANIFTEIFTPDEDENCNQESLPK